MNGGCLGTSLQLFNRGARKIEPGGEPDTRNGWSDWPKISFASFKRCAHALCEFPDSCNEEVFKALEIPKNGCRISSRMVGNVANGELLQGRVLNEFDDRVDQPLLIRGMGVR